MTWELAGDPKERAWYNLKSKYTNNQNNQYVE